MVIKYDNWLNISNVYVDMIDVEPLNIYAPVAAHVH